MNNAEYMRLLRAQRERTKMSYAEAIKQLDLCNPDPQPTPEPEPIPEPEPTPEPSEEV